MTEFLAFFGSFLLVIGLSHLIGLILEERKKRAAARKMIEQVFQTFKNRKKKDRDDE